MLPKGFIFVKPRLAPLQQQWKGLHHAIHAQSYRKCAYPGDLLTSLGHHQCCSLLERRQTFVSVRHKISDGDTNTNTFFCLGRLSEYCTSKQCSTCFGRKPHHSPSSMSCLDTCDEPTESSVIHNTCLSSLSYNLQFTCTSNPAKNFNISACTCHFSMGNSVLPVCQQHSPMVSTSQSNPTSVFINGKNISFAKDFLVPFLNENKLEPKQQPNFRRLSGYSCIGLHQRMRHYCQHSRSFSSLTSSKSGSLLNPVSHEKSSSCPFTKDIPIPEEEVTTTSIQTFLKDSNMKFTKGATCFHTLCPRVKKKPGQLQPANGDKLFVNMRTGHFLCQHCGKVGGWRELQDNITLLASLRKKKDLECCQNVDTVHNLNLDSKAVSDCLANSVPISELTDDEYERLMTEFGLSELKQSTLAVYSVRCDNQTPHLLFPAYTLDGQVIMVKKLSLKQVEGKIAKLVKEVCYPRLGFQGVFGLMAVSGLTGALGVQNGLVLTSSELDALAVFQETGTPALALTKGMTALPQEVLPSLEQFDKLILWFGGDVRAWETAKQFSQKLGVERCHIIRPSPEDPGPWMALQRGLRLSSTLARAKPVQHKSIVSFSQLRSEILAEMSHQEQVAGVKWRRYPALNRLLKGHRRGELTIFTGPTGSGKTTFMSDYSLDLAMQGVSTLWGSFEINNVRLGKMMLTQFSQTNLLKHLDQFDYWADRFEEIPMYFMTFHGQESIKRVIEAMSHAVYVHDIAHVVVDNLQFMMGSNGDWSDKFSKQDMFISAFRKFATAMNCHVTLVIHPRKEKDNEDLTTASVFGSAKATQEADNVLILQDKRLTTLRGKKYIQVTKNRFDGELGVMLLKFDKDTLSFSIKDKPHRQTKEPETKPPSEDTPEDKDTPQRQTRGHKAEPPTDDVHGEEAAL